MTKKKSNKMIDIKVTKEMIEKYPEEFEGLEVGDTIQVEKDMSVDTAKAYLAQSGVEALPKSDKGIIELAVKTASEELHKEEKKDKKEKIVKPYDGKYKVTFLVNQLFKGLYRPEGTTAIVPAHVAKAYGKRTTLKFEQLKK
jgi:hypothetical protein